MNYSSLPYRIFPLGDTAVTVEWENQISETVNGEVIARFQDFRENPIPGMTDLIPAYNTLTICYDSFAIIKKINPGTSILEWVVQKINQRLQLATGMQHSIVREFTIPVCYAKEYSPDMLALCEIKKMSQEEIISIHCSSRYKIFLMGFLPGFPYMGGLDERLYSPRKKQPLQVKMGSVGIAGKQTGIYPLDSPGGWNIIGRTPLRLFDPTKPEPVLLRQGDIIRFKSISKEEFENY